MTSKTYRSIRIFVLRWHRRIGVVLCFAIVWISLTGIFLNHMHEWGWAEKMVQNSWVRHHYAPAETKYYQVNDANWVAQTASGELLFNKASVGHCDGPLVGAVKTEMFVLACASKLIILAPSGDLLEQLGDVEGVPQGITHIGLADGQPAIKVGRWQAYDDTSITFKTLGNTPPLISKASPIPEAIYLDIAERLEPQPISIERILLDLHTGEFWGEDQRLLSDIVAILMMLVALGGVWVWLTKPGRFGR